MLHKLLFVLTALLLIGSPVVAQTCADVNQDGHVNVGDVVYMMVEHIGGQSIPAGKGDIDYRQGYNAGDLRFFVDYIFGGGPTPGCPPFPSYSLVHTNDSLILPSYVVPAGSGQFALPIYLINHAKVSDMVLPMQVTGLGSTVFFDSLQINSILNSIDSNTHNSLAIRTESVDGSTGVMAFSIIDHRSDFVSGINLLALAFFHYTTSPGGTVSMDTVTIRPHTFLNYVYGPSYAVGIPKVVVTATASAYPEMTVQPDTLFFETVAGNPDPGPQQFSIQSSGEPFDWTLTRPSWISVDATSGISGQTVSVTPNAAGLSIGVHYGDIIVFSTGALGSPQKVVVKLRVKPQFVSLDANCDGVFDIADIVVQINYMFRGGNLCNPCTGEWPKGK